MKQVLYPVEVGTWGRFKFGGSRVVKDWDALEDLCLEYCGGMWIGIYSAWDIVEWANRMGLFFGTEYREWMARLGVNV